MSELLLWFLQDWMERAKRIQCPAPLPEEPVIPRLAKMLVPAPYKAREKKANGAKSGPRRKGTSDVTSEDDEAHSSVPEDNDEEEEEEEENNPPPEERKKKRAASAHLEAETPKKGKGVPAVNTAWDIDSRPERHPRAKPRPHCK